MPENKPGASDLQWYIHVIRHTVNHRAVTEADLDFVVDKDRELSDYTRFALQ